MKSLFERGSVESDLNRHHVKYEDPLWDENLGEKKSLAINARLTLPKDKENIKEYTWHIYEDGLLVITLTGNLLTKKQIRFLLSKDGAQFLVESYKNGAKSVNRMRIALKQKIT